MDNKLVLLQDFIKGLFMATTRDYESLGVWASDAETTLPIVPLPGVAYRNASYSQSENEDGEKYDSIPDSANFNQVMFIITSYIDTIDKHGTVGWSNAVDYNVPAFTWADDGFFYFALQSSGPTTTIKDPSGDLNPDYWERIISCIQFELDLSSQTPGSEGSRLVGTTLYQANLLDPPVGATVYENLDNINERAYNLRGLRTLLDGSFDENGVLIGQGFNIKDNVATPKVSPQGIKYFLITPIDSSQGHARLQSQSPRVTPQRTINGPDPTNLLTANSYTIMGPWVAQDGTTIESGLDSIIVVFSEPSNVNITFYTPFTISIRAVDMFRDDYSPVSNEII